MDKVDWNMDKLMKIIKISYWNNDKSIVKYAGIHIKGVDIENLSGFMYF
jgi:hypothetical protein